MVSQCMAEKAVGHEQERSFPDILGRFAKHTKVRRQNHPLQTQGFEPGGSGLLHHYGVELRQRAPQLGLIRRAP